MSVYSQFISSGKKLKVQAFTASGSWVRPIGVDAVHLFMIAGGGGGGGAYKATADAAYKLGGGGAAGELYQGFVDVTSVSTGSTIAVTIGSGGAGGPASATPNGSPGGDSTFGSIITCVGGGYGGGNATSQQNGGAGVNVGGAGSGDLLGTGGALAGCGAGCAGHGIGPTFQSLTNYAYVPPQIANYTNVLPSKSNGFRASAPLVITNFTNTQASPSYSYGPGTGVIFNGKGYGAGGMGGMVNMTPYTNTPWGGAISGLDAIANSGAGGNGAIYFTNAIGGLAGGAGGSGYAYVSWFE